jgi:hypothetical protein
VGKRGDMHGEICRRVNMIQVLCHMYVNGKSIPVETITGMGEEEVQGNDGGNEFKYDMLDIYIV